MDRKAIGHDVWNTQLEKLRSLVGHGREFADLRNKLLDVLTDPGLEVAVPAELHELGVKLNRLNAALPPLYETKIGRASCRERVCYPV